MGAQDVTFTVRGHDAFVRLPERRGDGPLDWVWFAPVVDGQPSARHDHLSRGIQAAGLAFAGVSVGESYGSPAGREVFTAFHDEVTRRFGLARRVTLLAQSRGGLQHYAWASEHPDLVRRIGGIYPVCDLRDWPGLERAAPAYGLSPAELERELDAHNPLAVLEPLATAGVPVFHVHGDQDTVVPHIAHTEKLAARYRELGGTIEVDVVPGYGHEEADVFFVNARLLSFLLHGDPDGEPGR